MRSPCTHGKIDPSHFPGTTCIGGRSARKHIATRHTVHCSSSMTASVSKVQLLKGVSDLPLHYKVCTFLYQESPCTTGNEWGRAAK